MGVGSSNLSGRATGPTNHSIILESQTPPCRSKKYARHLHGRVQVRCNSGNTSPAETESAILFQPRFACTSQSGSRAFSKSRALRGLIWGTKLHVALCSISASPQFFLRHTQYPSLDPRHGAFGWRQVGFEKRSEATIPVGMGEPGSDAIGVMLIARPALTSKATTP
jgi:hypothetical protein